MAFFALFSTFVILFCNNNHFVVDEVGVFLYNSPHTVDGAVAERLKAPVC